MRCKFREEKGKLREAKGGKFKFELCRYNLIETMPISMMKHLDEDVPPVFMILDTFDKDVKSLVSLSFASILQGGQDLLDFWCHVTYLLCKLCQISA